MNRLAFFETIRVEDGVICNLELHIKRSSETIHRHFGIIYRIPFEEILDNYSKQDGIFKLRVVYSDKLISHTINKYTPQPLSCVKIVDCNDIEYSYKFENRSRLESLRALRGRCDDILIVKKGFVTDTSYGNLLFKLKGDTCIYTPETCLLRGTKREQMLCNGLIKERELTKDKLSDCEAFYMINAMVDPMPIAIEF